MSSLLSPMLALFSVHETGVVMQRLNDLVSLKHTFLIWTLSASLILGAVCGLVGTILTQRRLSLLGDAVGHATLPGVAGAFLVIGSQHPWGLLIGATITGLVSAWSVGIFSEGERTRPDAAIAVVIAGSFGIGTILFTLAQAAPGAAQAGLNSIFFGNIAAIRPDALTMIFVVSLILASVMILFWRPLALSSFDPIYAATLGVKKRAIDLLLLGLLAVTTVVAVQAAGVILVAAMLILPPTIARLFAKRLSTLAIWSTVTGGLCGLVGCVASYLFEGVATGPAMVVTGATIFGLLLLIKTVIERKGTRSAIEQKRQNKATVST